MVVSHQLQWDESPGVETEKYKLGINWYLTHSGVVEAQVRPFQPIYVHIHRLQHYMQYDLQHLSYCHRYYKSGLVVMIITSILLILITTIMIINHWYRSLSLK